jgi:hypothetical protein
MNRCCHQILRRINPPYPGVSTPLIGPELPDRPIPLDDQPIMTPPVPIQIQILNSWNPA